MCEVKEFSIILPNTKISRYNLTNSFYLKREVLNRFTRKVASR